MRLTFQVRFHTQPGQSLFLSSDHALFGDGTFETALPLQFLNDQAWQATVLVPRGAIPNEPIKYHYILRNPDGSLIHDWADDRFMKLAAGKVEEMLFVDSWNHAGFYENAFYTEPFRAVLLKANHTQFLLPAPAQGTHVFKAKAPLLAKGQTLCLLGSAPALGNWNTPVLLNRSEGESYLWCELDLSREHFPIEYKYGVYDLEQKTFVRYEEGGNRVLFDVVTPGKQTVVDDGFAVLPSTTWKGAGVAIPVFSLRSERSFGIGEFTDLALLADWCSKAGLKLIQILPVNDTTATHTSTDSYPYAAISAFALNPAYLNLDQVATGPNKKLLSQLEPERKRLNALDAVDYVAVVEAKIRFLKQIFPSQKKQTFRSADYKRFFELNRSWLVPYAVFCYLRDLYGTPDASRWPDHREFRTEEIAQLAAESAPAYEAVAFGYFVQFHLHLQLLEATRRAHELGVVLKGDIPIGAYRFGVDTWQHPDLFRLEMQAGAPPDAFGIKGQNWSFPTYNWPRMKQDGFAWWKQRFEQMGRYFDAFRIDHILGFFRIWSIPLNAVEGILGYFVPALPVTPGELEQRGVRFDRQRLVEPYLTDQVLLDIFGPDREAVRSQFLQESSPSAFRLKPEFSTQRQVEAHFASLEPSPRNDKLKEGLFDLLSNVILFEVATAQGPGYHFRFAVESTSSFKNLEPWTQSQLRELYLDYFFRRQEDFWMKEAMQKLPALKRVTHMLVCGEDLGMVPACVPVAMKDLGLLSLEVQRMPKALHQDFFRPKEAPYLSVVTPSTHDMSTIRGWWLEDRAVIQRFFNQELGLPGTAPETCEPWLNEAVIMQHLASPAMWSIFQLQDLLGMDGNLRRADPEAERINVPANPRNYWRYRMHLTLESLLAAKGFTEGLRSKLLENGRALAG